MRRRKRTSMGAVVLLIAVAAVGCSGGTPPEEERLRWSVDLRNWTVNPDSGQILLDTRIQGPTRTSITQLSFKATVLDTDQNKLREEWVTVDLTSIPRGGPEDKVFRIDGAEEAAGVTLDLVANPTDAERQQIAELAGAAEGS